MTSEWPFATHETDKPRYHANSEQCFVCHAFKMLSRVSQVFRLLIALNRMSEKQSPPDYAQCTSSDEKSAQPPPIPPAIPPYVGSDLPSAPPIAEPVRPVTRTVHLTYLKGPRMEFSDTFQSRPLVLVPPHTPCLFTENNLRVTDHHFFRKLFMYSKMTFSS